MFFSGVQVTGVAKLVLVKADTGDGLAYQLSGTDHVVGRNDGAILFPDDPPTLPTARKLRIPRRQAVRKR